MHKEFAIDPEVMSSLDRLQFLLNCIGYDKGRLIIGCPSKTAWYREVLSSCKIDDGMKHKVVEKLARLFFDKKAVLNKEMASWDINKPWIENAINLDGENNGNLFDGIVANDLNSGSTKVIGFDSLDDENPIWRCIAGKAERKSELLVKAAGILLRDSTEIIFVDRFMRTGKREYVNSLRSMLEAIFASSSRIDRNNNPVKRLEFHTSFNAVYDNPKEVKASFSAKFAGYIPIGQSLVVKRWESGSGKMHARYILTNLGGIAFDYGLDEGDGTTDIQILSDQLREERWRDFISCPSLKLHDESEIVIPGNRRF